jgi:DNA-binding MarR family transcriptional regulator
MTKKEAFIKMVEELLNPLDITEISKDETTKMALEYFDELKNNKTKDKVELTENGIKILAFMQNNYEKYNNIFKSKEIGEGLFVSSRSVSGSMKKLVTEGFVEKIGSDPVAYSITDKGKSKDLN